MFGQVFYEYLKEKKLRNPNKTLLAQGLKTLWGTVSFSAVLSFIWNLVFCDIHNITIWLRLITLTSPLITKKSHPIIVFYPQQTLITLYLTILYYIETHQDSCGNMYVHVSTYNYALNTTFCLWSINNLYWLKRVIVISCKTAGSSVMITCDHWWPFSLSVLTLSKKLLSITGTKKVTLDMFIYLWDSEIRFRIAPTSICQIFQHITSDSLYVLSSRFL